MQHDQIVVLSYSPYVPLRYYSNLYLPTPFPIVKDIAKHEWVKVSCLEIGFSAEISMLSQVVCVGLMALCYIKSGYNMSDVDSEVQYVEFHSRMCGLQIAWF